MSRPLRSSTRHEVKVVRPAVTTNPRGDATYDYGTAASRTSVGWSVVTPGATTEAQAAGRDMTSIVWSVVMEPGVQIGPRDGIEVDGELFAIDGEPLRWQSFSGALDHIGVTLRRWA